MFKSFMTWLDENRDYGFSFWYAYDPVNQKASVTLFFAYVSFLSALGAGILALWYPSMLLGAITLMTFNVVMVVLYMVRKLNKAKFDLDDRSFELESEKEEK